MIATCVANHLYGYGRSLISLPCSPTARRQKRGNLNDNTNNSKDETQTKQGRQEQC